MFQEIPAAQEATNNSILNTRGCVYTHHDGLVLRSTYHVFDLYVNYLGDEILDGWMENDETMHVLAKDGHAEDVAVLDVLPTRISESGMVAIAAVNKHADQPRCLTLDQESAQAGKEYRVITVNGESPDSYNDVGMEQVTLTEGTWQPVQGPVQAELQAHSVNVIQIRYR